VNFVDWSRVGERYFHPFNAPSQRPGAPELMPYWLLGEADGARVRRGRVDAAARGRRVARAQARAATATGSAR
jgi:hypothetical protein